MAERTEGAQAPRDESAQDEPQTNMAQQAAGAWEGDVPGEQLQAARAEAAEYKDKYLRELADKDNFRKRQERITTDRVQRARRDLLEKVLEVTDNLDRAMRYESTMDATALVETLRLLQSQLTALLTVEGVTPLPAAAGARFDPHMHEAVESVASEDHPEGAVVEEVRRGYRLGDELLRPTRVTVSAGKK
jgi:molecular chaperone GrpE